MIQIPNYTVKEVIGQGGMALVYLATQDMLSREVALKVLMPDMMKDDNLRKSFLNEGKIVASLKHPNIVSIFDIGIVDDSIFYMAMEYISGGTLKEKLLKERFSYDGAIKALEEISDGLSYAHEQGYIHRDVKPGNILFREDGSAVITDFGIAKLQNTSGDLTRLGLTVGTAQYMSPEQAKSSEIDSRSDIYSLGLVFFEMLTGEKAYKFDTNYQAIQQHTSAPPPKLPKELSSLQKVINKVLAKQPKRRYQTTGEFIQAIKDSGQPLSNTSSTRNTIYTDETLIHGTQQTLNTPIKSKSYLLLMGVFSGLALIGGIAFGVNSYLNNGVKPDDVVNTIKQNASAPNTPPITQTAPEKKPDSLLLAPSKKDNSSKCRRGKVLINDIQVNSATTKSKNNTACKKENGNNKIVLKTKPPIANYLSKACNNLSSLVENSLSSMGAGHDDDIFGMSAHNSGAGFLCAQKDLNYQLSLYKKALEKGDYGTLDKFIYPPISKGRSLKSMGNILKLAYLPNDNIKTHTQAIELPFRIYSKGIYVKTWDVIAMSRDFALSQEDLQEYIKNDFLKEAQKLTANNLKKEFGAFDIHFKKDTLEATFYKKEKGIAIYELNKGWSIMAYDAKTLKIIKDDLPKKIARFLTRF